MVLRATLETGEQFVVDFTHYQWGWWESLYDWNTFVEMRTSFVIEVAPIGQWCGVTCQARNIAPVPKSYDFGIVMLRKEIMKAVVERLHQLLSPYPDWEAVVGLSLGTFLTQCDDISQEIEQIIRHAQLRSGTKGLGRIYFEEAENFWRQGGDNLWRTASWRHNVTVRSGTVTRHNDVWLSE